MSQSFSQRESETLFPSSSSERELIQLTQPQELKALLRQTESRQRRLKILVEELDSEVLCPGDDVRGEIDWDSVLKGIND